MLEDTDPDRLLLQAVTSIAMSLRMIETHLEKISHWPEFEPPLYYDDDEPGPRPPVHDNPGPDQIPDPTGQES
jgi:hypothetical protein